MIVDQTALAIFICCIVIILAVFVGLVIFLLRENRKLTLKNKIMGIQPLEVPQVKSSKKKSTKKVKSDEAGKD